MLKVLLKTGPACGLIAHVCEIARAAPVAVVLSGEGTEEEIDCWRSVMKGVNGDPATWPGLFLPREEVPVRYQRIFVIENEDAFTRIAESYSDALVLTLCWPEHFAPPKYQEFDAKEQLNFRTILRVRAGQPLLQEEAERLLGTG